MSELDEFADVRFVLWQCDSLRHFAIDRSVSRIQRPHQIIEIKLAVEFGGELLPIGGRAHDRPSHRLGTRATPRKSKNQQTWWGEAPVKLLAFARFVMSNSRTFNEPKSVPSRSQDAAAVRARAAVYHGSARSSAGKHCWASGA